MDGWQARYRRAVLDFIGAPDNVDLDEVVITTSWNEAWGYSEYTNGDAEIELYVNYPAPEDVPWPENYPYRSPGPRYTKGETIYHSLHNSEVAELINSFG
jgi:hypothetical protein